MSYIALILSITVSRKWQIAVNDLFSGKAYNYHLEMQTRFEQFEKGSEQDYVIIKPIKNRPLTIFSEIDIGPNRDGGWNLSYEQYFQTSRIYLEGDEIIE